MHETTDKRIAEAILTSLHRVHARLGPGFSRGVYRRALAVEVARTGCKVTSDVELEVFYKGRPIGAVETDLVVGGRGLVLVGTSRLLSADQAAQLASVVRATGWPWGLLCNFGPVPEHWLVHADGGSTGNLSGIETRAGCAT